MHSAMNSRKTKPFRSRGFIIAVAALAVLGCRSGRPSGSMVQVTEDPAAIVTQVPAPEQRLATTATGKQSAAGKHLAGNAQSDTKKSDLASAVMGASTASREKPIVQSPTTSMSLTDSSESAKSGPNQTPSRSQATVPTKQTIAAIADALADLKQPASPKSSKDEQPDAVATAGLNTKTSSRATQPKKTETKSAPKDAVEVTLGGLVSASLTDLSPNAASVARNVEKTATKNPSSTVENNGELVRSNANHRPTVKRRPMNQTDHPNALTLALKQSLSSLPSLPQTPPNVDGRSPTRIGTGQAKLARNEKSVAKPSEETSRSPFVGDLVANSDATVAAKTPLPETDKGSTDKGSKAMSANEEEPSVVMNANRVRPVSHAGDDSTLDIASLRHSSELEALPPPPVENQKLPESSSRPEPSSHAAQPLNEQELYKQLLARLSEPQPGESPTERERRQIVMRHLMVLAGRPDDAVDSMDGMNPTEQRYMKNQLLGLWTMINPDGHPSSGRRITEALPKFREATRYMATATDSLALRSLEFCTEIESYGQIKPFDGNRFVPGQQVILYCEVENFAAAERGDHFQTQLQGSYDIYNAGGTKVLSQLLPVDQQRSRNQLRDYFVAYQMNLPKGLPAGTYRLQLTLEDVVGKKYGQANIPFEIH